MAHHILFTGGGTLGPVTPLLAVAAEWRKHEGDVRFSWIGTPHGPERSLIEGAKIPFFSLSAPKFDRSRKWTLPFVPFFFLISFIKSWNRLKELQPSLVMSAGAYVSLPIVIAAWMRRIPVWIHQLDVAPGLANKLMAPFATHISVAWSQSADAFPKKKTTVVGGMARLALTFGNRSTAYQRYSLRSHLPTVLVIGGGTGATSINHAMTIIAEELLQKVNVIHLTGQGKMLPDLQKLHEAERGYVALEFLQEGMADAFAAADIVVCRAGMGTIAELALLGKPAILVPRVATDQEANATALQNLGAANVIREITPQILLQEIQKLLHHPEDRQALARNICAIFPLNAEERIVEGAMGILKE